MNTFNESDCCSAWLHNDRKRQDLLQPKAVPQEKYHKRPSKESSFYKASSQQSFPLAMSTFYRSAPPNRAQHRVALPEVVDVQPHWLFLLVWLCFSNESNLRPLRWVKEDVYQNWIYQSKVPLNTAAKNEAHDLQTANISQNHLKK